MISLIILYVNRLIIVANYITCYVDCGVLCWLRRAGLIRGIVGLIKLLKFCGVNDEVYVGVKLATKLSDSRYMVSAGMTGNSTRAFGANFLLATRRRC